MAIIDMALTASSPHEAHKSHCHRCSHILDGLNLLDSSSYHLRGDISGEPGVKVVRTDTEMWEWS
jgi:hypothetical protein